MNKAVMMERETEVSPRTKARIAGVFYLLEGATSAFGAIYVVSMLTVTGNAEATAASVLTQQPLLWWAFATALIAVACHIVYTVLFYDLFNPVNRSIFLIAASFSLVAIAIQGCASLFQVAPLLVLKGGGYLSVFNAGQLHALALMFLNLDKQIFNIYLVLFGFWLVLTGYLIFRSVFMPRFLGVLVVLSGFSYLTLLSPSLANYLFPYYLAPDAIGEPLLILWLLIVGVNAELWKERERPSAHESRCLHQRRAT